MSKQKQVRTLGKLRLSRYFQQLNPGDSVSVIRELSVPSIFPIRLQGRTGTVKGKRGRSYIVDIKEMNKTKMFIIAPIHLKKIAMTPGK